MRELSDVTYLMASGAADLDKARERFGWEIQEFVRDLVVEARREPALLAVRRMRIDLTKEVRPQSRGTVAVSKHLALADAAILFKRRSQFRSIGTLQFGIVFDESLGGFAWRVQFDSDSQHLTLDDQIWAAWQTKVNGAKPPGSAWLSDVNTVRFSLRALGKDLKSQTAYEDLSMVLQFLRASYPVIAQTVGADPEGETA